MPTENSNPTVFIPDGNPDDYNESTIRRAGDLGTRFPYDDRVYGVVKLDSGATASTPIGAVAANQLAYWKDRNNHIVTNDVRFSELNYTGVAGIFRLAVTAGNYCAVLVKGRAINVNITGTGFTAGDNVEANDSSPAADAKRIAKGSAVTTVKIGMSRAAEVGSAVSTDVDIPWVP